MPIWYPVPSALVGFLDVGHHFFFVGRYLAVDQRRRLGYKPDFKSASLDYKKGNSVRKILDISAASSDLKYWNPSLWF
ncbi:uncharacterized protein OCT59_008579 [Rhizophagus irregularis]|uniref:uncharacterized protein n=1 Tax=Rhizophagus irregularis TaxID=588596 RepID=UPI003319ED08|nr:hypothetical protein OCT59_008579 [Rhizophagus irregularis]